MVLSVSLRWFRRERMLALGFGNGDARTVEVRRVRVRAIEKVEVCMFGGWFDEERARNWWGKF